MRTVLNIIILVLLFLGCDRVSHEKHYDKPYAPYEDLSFEDWQDLPKLNAHRLESTSHKAYIDIHINKLGIKAYVEQLDEFPVGTQIIKPLFSTKTSKKIHKLAIMVKKEKGFDTEHGDWWYGVYDAKGKEAWHQGKIHSCIKCHETVKETDYLFSEKVMDNIDMQD